MKGPRRSLAVLAVVLGCGGTRGPVLDPREHVQGEHTRVIHESPGRLWPGFVQALDEEGLTVAHTDRARGTISTRPRRYAERDVLKRLAQIGDLSRVRGAGLGRVSELLITYHLLLLPAEADSTRLLVRSVIDAIDRSEAMLLGPGLLEVIPRHIEVPSRGVVERELVRHLAASLFTAEEMLFLLGEPGVD